MHPVITAGVGRAVTMSQGEISPSTEASEEDEFIAVWPWVDPDHSKSDGLDSGQDRVLVARSQVSWVEIRGHLIELYTVTGEKYGLRGTLKSLEQRWARYGFVRIHKSYLIFLPHVRQLRPTPGVVGRCTYVSVLMESTVRSAGGVVRSLSRCGSATSKHSMKNLLLISNWSDRVWTKQYSHLPRSGTGGCTVMTPQVR
jgi:hypothetical protein